MAQHIFLTGKKQVGKSTLLKKVIQQYNGTIEGFFTVRTNEFLKDRYSVHLFSANEEMIPSENNLLFVCGIPDDHISDRFNRLGCQALSRCSDCSLILMDELGPHEANALLFRNAVLQLLDLDIPILGVLQEPTEMSWAEITHHSNVEILEITKKNRDQTELIEKIFTIIHR